MNITELCGKLRVSYIRNNWQQLTAEARHTKQDYEAFLTNLLDMEWRQRLENGQGRRIKEAKFPLKKYLCDILLGTSGAGKTHYAIALGIAACMKGHSVLFASVPNLIIELKETVSSNGFSDYRRRFAKYDLVILDEMGYISMDKNGCEMLFNLISSRNEKGSVLATSNLTFDRWEEVFKDPTLTGALIDRLAHKAHVLDISREKGGRFEETIAWLEDSKR
jgi:DNA replication protein DnaC